LRGLSSCAEDPHGRILEWALRGLRRKGFRKTGPAAISRRFPGCNDTGSICYTSAWWLLVCGSGEQQQIPIRIFDDEIPGAPGLLLQCLLEGHASGLKLQKQRLDLLRRRHGERGGKQLLAVAQAGAGFSQAKEYQLQQGLRVLDLGAAFDPSKRFSFTSQVKRQDARRAEYAQRHSEAGYQLERREVPCTTLDRICADYGVATVHFLKIDVEGSERGVLEGFSFETVRPWLVVVEATEPNSEREIFAEWEDLLLGRGYRFIYFDGLNRFYAAEEHADLARHFSRPPNWFDQYVSYELWRTRADLEEAQAAERNALVNSLNHTLAEVQSARAEAQSLREAMAEREHVLRKAMAEREQTLQEAMAERDRQLSSLQEAVAERARLLGSLQEAVAERARQLSGLQTLALIPI